MEADDRLTRLSQGVCCAYRGAYRWRRDWHLGQLAAQAWNPTATGGASRQASLTCESDFRAAWHCRDARCPGPVILTRAL